MNKTNSDARELAKFSELAHRWWDPDSEFRPLHEINPLRLEWIDGLVGLNGKYVLDVGCGGGILAESMGRRGAHVTGIDLSEKALSVAKLHLLETNQQGVSYRLISAENLAQEEPTFDAITCMEMLEHVPDPHSILQACARMLKPEGRLFLATLNRTPKSYLFAILGAEYVLNMLPHGTHDYHKFIKPSELAGMAREVGLGVEQIIGMTYNPFAKTCHLGNDTDINYLMQVRKS